MKVDPINHEKTHVFLPGEHSLELCQTEHQDKVAVDLVEGSISRGLWSR